MEELFRAVTEGEQSLSCKDFYAALSKCEPMIAHSGSPEGATGGHGSTSDGLSSGKEGTSQGVSIVLENQDLWNQFNDITNEMIVTKAGRRMFPLLQISLSGLDPSSSYALFLQFQLAYPHRWRFLNGEWQEAGSGCTMDPPEEGCVYIHHSSPLSGAQWMKEKIIFSKLKLSNKENGKGKIKLYSLYRYQPRVVLVRLPSSSSYEHVDSDTVTQEPTTKTCNLAAAFIFPQTQFVAVTAYQNDKITQMKIKHNPYAKAFQGPQGTSTVHFPRGSEDGLAASSEDASPHHFRHVHPMFSQTAPIHPVLGHPIHHGWLSTSQYLQDGYLTKYHPYLGSETALSGDYYGQHHHLHPLQRLQQQQQQLRQELQQQQQHEEQPQQQQQQQDDLRTLVLASSSARTDANLLCHWMLPSPTRASQACSSYDTTYTSQQACANDSTYPLFPSIPPLTPMQ